MKASGSQLSHKTSKNACGGTDPGIESPSSSRTVRLQIVKARYTWYIQQLNQQQIEVYNNVTCLTKNSLRM